MRKLLYFTAVCLMALQPGMALAVKKTGYVVQVVKSDFETAVFDLENAIVNRGLTIDRVGHVGKMLERTSKATGSTSPYIGARYFSFCSAKLSHATMQADPDNLAICPYVMFVYELKSEPGKARIGYRRPIGSEKPSAKKSLADIEKLLGDLLKDAAK
jgi:uncharacterized protein (DUF302 family)